nr:hypothetical protein [Micromonospora sp. DSM 115978]
VYGTLAAPVAALLFFYITALAVLLGAELNAAMDSNRQDRLAIGPASATPDSSTPNSVAGPEDADETGPPRRDADGPSDNTRDHE